MLSGAIRRKTLQSSHPAWVETWVGTCLDIMALSVNKLSTLGVGKAGTPGYYGDGGGLWLQVCGSGSKSWPD